MAIGILEILLQSERKKEGKEIQHSLYHKTVSTLATDRRPIFAMIIKPLLLYDKSIILNIKGKLLWMLPRRKDFSISLMQNLEWPPLAVRDRHIFNYKRMDMLLIQLKRQGGCRKKGPGATKRSRRWEKRAKERFWKISDRRGCTMGINQTLDIWKGSSSVLHKDSFRRGKGMSPQQKPEVWVLPLHKKWMVIWM